MSTALIDTNITLGRWPFRRLRGDDTPELVQMLRAHGITQAWAGTYDALLHKDIAGANLRLVEECHHHGHGILVPFGAVNPSLPDWEEDLRRCAEDHKMPGIRLHPNYHGYKLDDPVFDRLLALAQEHKLLVQISVSLEDERSHHRLLQIPDVNVTPLPKVLKKYPAVKVILLNSFRTVGGEKLLHLETVESIYCEIATIESLGGIAKTLMKTPLSRILFGSGAPFYYLESALLKLKESNLSAAQLAAIRHENAAALRGR